MHGLAILIDKKTAIPITVHHLIERLGLFILLVHGESILALIAAVNAEYVQEYVVEIVGFLLVFLLRQLYSTSNPSEPSRHALRRGRFFQNLFYYGHVFLGATLLGIGTSIKVILEEAFHHDIGYRATHLFFYSLASYLFVLCILRLSHVHVAYFKLFWAVRLLAIFLLISLSSLSDIHALSVLFSPIAMILIGTGLIWIVSIVDRLEYDAPKVKHLPQLKRQFAVSALDTANI
jgi:low temperature requirement protein LtrA